MTDLDSPATATRTAIHSDARIGTPPPRISAAEFAGRQQAARSLAADRALAGWLVWSRGGHTTDRFYDVHWLTGYTSQFPFIPDGPGWSARSHAAYIIPVDGPAVLVADMPAYREDLTTADRVVIANDVAAVVTADLLAAAIPTGRIGVIGADTLAWPWYDTIVRRAGERLERHDDAGWWLRQVKSPAELALLRHAAAIGSAGVDAVLEACIAGATEADAAAAGIAMVAQAGAVVHGISISSGLGSVLYAQSQPAPYDVRRALCHGDLARVDFYGSFDGYLFDLGRSTVVGHEPTADQQALLDAVRDTSLAGVAAVRAGATVGDIARACDDHWADTDLVRRGLVVPTGFAAWGHATSLCWEEPWIGSDCEIELQPGMVFCIEKRQPVPGLGGANFEETVVVTEGGYELLTSAVRDRDRP